MFAFYKPLGVNLLRRLRMKQCLVFTIISVVLITLLVSIGQVQADVSGSVYMAGVTKYLWRGQELYRKGALQPGLDLTYKKLSLGIWGSFNLGDNVQSKRQAYGEADFTLGLSDSYKKLGYSVGYTYYTFPSPSVAPSLSSEYYCGLSMDVFLSPGVTVYYDVASGDGVYAELSAAQHVQLGLEFEMEAGLGYNAGQWGYHPSLSVATFGLATTFSFGSFDLTPSIEGEFALNDQYHNDGYGSISFSYNF
jgi:hypothetical protein